MKANALWRGAALLLALLGLSCSRAPTPVRLVRIESNSPVYQSVWGPTIAWPTDSAAQALLLHDRGLLLDVEKEHLFQYRWSDGPVLRLHFAPWCVRLRDHIVSIVLNEDSARTWLPHASKQELSELRTIELPDSLDPALVPPLRRLAEVNPELLLSGPDRVQAQLLPYFRPWELSVDSPQNVAAAKILAGVRTLYASPSDSLGQLTSFHRLERLWIQSDESQTIPAGMTHLRSLELAGKMEGLNVGALVQALPPDLEELSLSSSDSLDVAPIARLTKLRVLRLSESRCAGMPDFAQMKNLQWVGLPKNATQAELGRLIAAHPDLRILEVASPDSTIDLASLRGLRQPDAVILDHDYPHVEALNELKSLRFVRLPGDTTSESRSRIASLRAALPEAIVVPTSGGPCLGSGWILALVAVAALAASAGRRSWRHTHRGHDH